LLSNLIRDFLILHRPAKLYVKATLLMSGNCCPVINEMCLNQSTVSKNHVISGSYSLFNEHCLLRIWSELLRASARMCCGMPGCLSVTASHTGMHECSHPRNKNLQSPPHCPFLTVYFEAWLNKSYV
jgi:hypothetical protein